MQIHLGHQGVPEAGRGAVVVLGNFDGVHRGHRAVIDAARAVATGKGWPLAVLTFEPHPRSFFQPKCAAFRLTDAATKADLLEAAGVDWLFQAAFDRAFASLEAEAFVREVLVAGLGASHVVCGYDFVFGRGRSGNTKMLEGLGRTLGFGVTVVAPVRNGDAAYSSTVIRGLLQEGRPREAAAMLGHNWTIEGEVRGGDRRGRTIGFPTANVELGDFLVPALGVYAVRAGLEGWTAVASGIPAWPISAAVRPSTSATSCSRCISSIFRATCMASACGSSSWTSSAPSRSSAGWMR